MYLEHFGLEREPFRLSPDSDFLYLSKAHARAKAYLDYTVWSKDGFVVITGEIGCGKTTLIQKLLAELGDDVAVAKIYQTQLNEIEFLQSILVEFGFKPFSAKKVELLDMLNSFLIDQYSKGRQVILIIDEAQNLSIRVLEEVRLLSGMETSQGKILNLILVGQPELREKLLLPEVEQLSQRIRLRFHIKELNKSETIGYIIHRLKVAGLKSNNLFGMDTLPIIYEYTGGVPRLINILCDTALICAYTNDEKKVTAAVIHEAVDELEWQPYHITQKNYEKVKRKRMQQNGGSDIYEMLNNKDLSNSKEGGEIQGINTSYGEAQEEDAFRPDIDLADIEQSK